MATTLAMKVFTLNIVQVPVLHKICSQVHTQCSPLLFRASQQLWAEPMKKKKKADPGLIAAREAKKIRKLEKEIKRLTKFGRILKPVEELEMSNKKLLLAKERKRENPKLSSDESESRSLLQKKWSQYCRKKSFNEHSLYNQMVAAQDQALQELRAESEELYQSALQIDYSFIPIHFQGPKLTPAIKDYDVPDGEYIDKTRKY